MHTALDPDRLCNRKLENCTLGQWFYNVHTVLSIILLVKSLFFSFLLGRYCLLLMHISTTSTTKNSPTRFPFFGKIHVGFYRAAAWRPPARARSARSSTLTGAHLAFAGTVTVVCLLDTSLRPTRVVVHVRLFGGCCSLRAAAEAGRARPRLTGLAQPASAAPASLFPRPVNGTADAGLSFSLCPGCHLVDAAMLAVEETSEVFSWST